MKITRTASFEIVEREKMALLSAALRHIDWLNQEELALLRLAADICVYEYSSNEMSHLKATLDKIIKSTKSSDTEKWASDMYVVVSAACDKLR